MAHEVEIRDVEPQSVLAVRGDQVPSSGIAEFMAEAYGKIARHAAALGLQPSGKPMARYQNIEGDRFDVEAVVPFAEAVEGEADVYSSSLQSGRAVTCEHVGPHDQLGGAYAAIGAWLARQGLRPAGPGWEEYLSGPGDVAPAECRTRVYLPISRPDVPVGDGVDQGHQR